MRVNDLTQEELRDVLSDIMHTCCNTDLTITVAAKGPDPDRLFMVAVERTDAWYLDMEEDGDYYLHVTHEDSFTTSAYTVLTVKVEYVDLMVLTKPLRLTFSIDAGDNDVYLEFDSPYNGEYLQKAFTKIYDNVIASREQQS